MKLFIIIESEKRSCYTLFARYENGRLAILRLESLYYVDEARPRYSPWHHSMTAGHSKAQNFRPNKQAAARYIRCPTARSKCNNIYYTTYIRETRGRYKSSIGLPYARARLVQINGWNTIEGGNKCTLGVFYFMIQSISEFKNCRVVETRRSSRLFQLYSDLLEKKEINCGNKKIEDLIL